MLLDPGLPRLSGGEALPVQKGVESRLPQARSYRLRSGRVGPRIPKKDAVWLDAALQVTIHNSLALSR